jgi:hypothetical protein
MIVVEAGVWPAVDSAKSAIGSETEVVSPAAPSDQLGDGQGCHQHPTTHGAASISIRPRGKSTFLSLRDDSAVVNEFVGAGCVLMSRWIGGANPIYSSPNACTATVDRC